MRHTLNIAVVCALVACGEDHAPKQQCDEHERRVAALEYTLQEHIARIELAEGAISELRARGAATPVEAVDQSPSIQDPCPDPTEWQSSRFEKTINMTVSEPPSGLPAFKLYHGLWDEAQCLPPESPCRQRYSKDLTAEQVDECGYPSHSSWAKLLQGALRSFLIEPSIYAGQPHVYVGYGLLQGGNAPAIGYYPALSADLRVRALPQIYRSQALLKLVYAWAMPHLKQAWQQLSPSDQRIYMNAFEHGQQYLARYRHDLELTYLRTLERGECYPPEWLSDHDHDGVDDDHDGKVDEDEWKPTEWCPNLFTMLGPDGKYNPYRKLEAFFFRRARDGMKVSQMRYWLSRVVVDLRPLMRPVEVDAKTR